MLQARTRRLALILSLAFAASAVSACAASPLLPSVDLSRTQVDQGGTTFRQGLGTAATAPLDDLNLRRKHVPEVLVEARGNPYSIEHLQRCSDIDAGINDLDDALGPDVDQTQPITSTGDQAANAALDMVRDTATDFIPLRSWVRRLSGADAHDRDVQAAIRAGSVRRGFLKGIAWQRQCPSND